MYSGAGIFTTSYPRTGLSKGERCLEYAGAEKMSDGLYVEVQAFGTIPSQPVQYAAR
jgi:hypothetical protein